MLDLNKPPGSAKDGHGAEAPDHVPVMPEDSSSGSDDTLSSSASTFLGDLWEKLEQSNADNVNAECTAPKQHLDFAQLDLPIDQHDGERKEMVMNAQLATNLKRYAAGGFKAPGDHHAHHNDTTSGMLHSPPPKKAHAGNLVEEVHTAPIGPNALPFVGIAQPTRQGNIVVHGAPSPVIPKPATPQVYMPPPLHLVEHNQANILEQVATPPLSPRQPSSQHTSAQMETMEGLRARALSHTTELAGSRSRSPTPESSLRPIAPDQEAISTVDLARILQSLHGSHVLLDHNLHPMPPSSLPFDEALRSIWAPAPVGNFDLDDPFELAQMSVADLLAGWATNTNQVPVLTTPAQPPTQQGREHPTGMPGDDDDASTSSSEDSSPGALECP